MNRVLLIVGKSPEVWDDVEAFWDFGVAHDVCCLNEIGIVYPCDVNYWFSYHSTELVHKWATQRPGLPLFTSGRPQDGVCRVKLVNTSGSSSLMAVRVMRALFDYQRIVLAGVAMTGRHKGAFLKHWFQADDEISPFVRSMSGNTRKLLGAPEAAWLGVAQ